MLTYCKHCVMPDTKPDLHLDEHGVCNACRSYERRKEVDWDRRYQELLQVLEKDLDAYSDFVENVLRRQPGIASIQSSLALREIKSTHRIRVPRST